MLQVSDAAATALDEARQAQELPESVGVRVFAQPTDGAQASVSVIFADAPLEEDEVTEQSGTRFFIAPEVAEPLSDSVIDVEDTPQGPGLVIKPQDDAT